MLKPNICGFDGFKSPEKTGDDGVRGRVTNPEFVRGVIHCLKRRGHERITIAEGCGNSNAHWRRAVAVSGFDQLAREEGIPLVALDDDGFFDVEGTKPGKPLAISGIEKSHVPTLLMPRLLGEILQDGLFISIPKLKTHRYSVVSLGIKGMQGTVQRSEASPAYNQKWRMHAELKEYLRGLRAGVDDRAAYVASLEAFTERVLDVLEISLPDAVLLEGTPAMSGDGFQTLRAIPGMIAIGGTHPVWVDRVGAEYLGLWDNAGLAAELAGHRSSPLIERAAERYGLDLRYPGLRGDGVKMLKEKRPVFFKALAPFTIQDQSPDQTPAPTPSPLGGAPQTSQLGPKQRPEARAFFTSSAPQIDGKADSQWEQATPAVWNTDYAGMPTATTTRARFLWQKHALFALFELSNTSLNVDSSFPVDRERPKLYQEDCVELFLSPNPEYPGHYFEIELGPRGHWFDLEVDRSRGVERSEWSSGVRLSTRANETNHSALIEAQFTAPELLKAI
ncbi:MAG TPA: DUF362 domain-containing protein [Polyangiaceae bacterium]|nr:DUF362 domain-containing protein [Polyangiaceae bacterium]